jgi:hypothetical protein
MNYQLLVNQHLSSNILEIYDVLLTKPSKKSNTNYNIKINILSF